MYPELLIFKFYQVIINEKEYYSICSMGLGLSDKHSKTEILSVLKDTDNISVSTLNGVKIRSRIMHFVNDDKFNVYLASQKGDPKTLQITQNPAITLLALKCEGDFPAETEIEISGQAEIVNDESSRIKWFKEEASKSPIVKYMIETNNTDKLDLIHVRPEIVKYRRAQDIVQGIPPTILEFPENKQSTNDIVLLKQKTKNWITEMRLPFLTASIIPILLGTAIAGTSSGIFNPLYFILALFGGISLHLGANVLNDYFDHKSGADEKNTEFIRPFTGGSRTIQLGLLTPIEVLTGGLFFLVLGTIIGVYFILTTGVFVAFLLVVGIISAYFYTAPPINLASRGIGEVFIGLNFGVLMTLGAFFVQTQTISIEPILASIPVALLIAAVLYINEFPDYNSDKDAGKKHIVVRLGRSRASIGYFVIIVTTYASILLGVILQITPIYSLISFATVPLSMKGVKSVLNYHSQIPNLVPANVSTVNVHLLTGILLTLGYVVSIVPSYQLLVSIIIILISGAFVMKIYRSLSMAENAAKGLRSSVASGK
jgi:1,4-dihydroxy-2-naphthoate octaprenyltransferase